MLGCSRRSTSERITSTLRWEAEVARVLAFRDALRAIRRSRRIRPLSCAGQRSFPTIAGLHGAKTPFVQSVLFLA